MKKLILVIAALGGVGAVGLALAQENIGSDGNPPALRYQNSRNNPSGLPKYVHPPNPKKKAADKPRFFPLAKISTPNPTPQLPKIKAPDKTGHPVTLWQGVHKKNYSTLYQDPQN